MIQHDGKKPPRQIFSLEVLTTSRIQGWVYDPESTETPQRVLIYLNGNILGDVVADQSRPDLEQLGLGSCAFDWRFDPNQLPSKVTSVELRLSSGELLFASGLWMGGIETSISSNDEMFRGNYSHYFRVGAEAAGIVAEHAPSNLRSILDLPCGHGRVARHLRVRFPESQLVCCDINRDGVGFCQSSYAATGMYSNTELDVHFDQKFDAIWVGSLVTHFSEVYTTRFLQWAFDLLAPSGIAIVTTHGNYVNSRLTTENYGILQKGIDDIRADLDNKGYGYSDYPEQEDYGISVVSRDWYDALVSGYPNMEITAYLEQRWDNHHDVLIIKNTE